MQRILRNKTYRAWFFQALLVGGLLAVVAVMWRNAQLALAARGIQTGFGFLGKAAEFSVSESVIPFAATDSVFRAFLVGLFNTFSVSVASIILATVLGVLVGIARLSSNRLLSGLARIYVEVFRNTPQLVQIIFWYTLVLALPSVRTALDVGFGVFISNRGVNFPWFADPATGGLVAIGLAVGVLGSIGVVCLPGRRRWRAKAVAGLALGVPALAFAASGFDVSMSVPALKGFNFKGGGAVSPEFLALFLGLGLYIGAFVAEIVRAGLLSVDKGQIEAGHALGLPPSKVLFSVRIPQALRVIVPPIAAQYISLVKNSSLGVAIGYPELFNLSNSIATLSGQAIECVAIMGVLYLLTALGMSALSNAFNRMTRIVER